jgi:NAD+ synthetase
MSQTIDYSKASRVMIDSMKEYFKKCNLHAAVLGISGGIDSTLVAVLMHKVSQELNSENYAFTFYGVSLPTPTTPENEFWASQMVGHAFCDSFYVDKEMDEVSRLTKDWVSTWKQEKIEPLRYGNIKARLRMIYLYDLAKKVGGIVMGTDNFTEYLLGFSTIGGDALFDYNPIQELWKTEVFDMAEMFMDEYANDRKFEEAAAIETSLRLKPMDGLGISNDDMAQIGARNYYDVDVILQWYFEHKDEPGYPDWINNPRDGYMIEAAAMEKVINRHKASEFKRNHPVTLSRARFM